jgi:ribulose-phosphate 3-epimerase
MSVEILPAVLATQSATLRRRWVRAARLGQTVHLDVMDGVFVPGKSPDQKIFAALPFNRVPVEWHLMTEQPEAWLPLIRRVRTKRAVLHVELGRKLKKILPAFRSAKIPVSLAINPSTSFQQLARWQHLIESVTIMGVRPGQYGSRFQPKALKHVVDVRRRYPRLLIAWDGGVRPTTIKKIVATGVKRLAVGSYVLAAPNPKQRLRRLQAIVSSLR